MTERALDGRRGEGECSVDTQRVECGRVGRKVSQEGADKEGAGQDVIVWKEQPPEKEIDHPGRRPSVPRVSCVPGEERQPQLASQPSKPHVCSRKPHLPCLFLCLVWHPGGGVV